MERHAAPVSKTSVSTGGTSARSGTWSNDYVPEVRKTAPSAGPQKETRLLPFASNNDTEHFLTTFERIAQVCRWLRFEQAVCLVPLLSRPTHTADVLLWTAPMEILKIVKEVKEAIQAKYEITADTYQCRLLIPIDWLKGGTTTTLCFTERQDGSSLKHQH